MLIHSPLITVIKLIQLILQTGICHLWKIYTFILKKARFSFMHNFTIKLGS